MNRQLLHHRGGASAAEFALVLPVLIILLMGIIDAGRWIWTYNRAEKATQMGARMAVVTNHVSSNIGATYVGACSPPLTQGDLIPSSCFSTITCTNSGCSAGTTDSAAFTTVVNRMRVFLPDIQPANVSIEYSSAGLGYAGNPTGPDLVPLVTVKLGTPTALQFRPVTSLMFATLNMPTFTTSLTSEDLVGLQSN